MAKHVILVTGGNGFIGSHVAKRLHDQGYYVRVVDLHGDPTFRIHKDTSEFCSEFIEGDIRCIETCHKLFAKNDVKWVFHFAANMGGLGVINSKNNFVIYKENHLMSLNILQASMHSNVEKFFYASSACVYPCNKQTNVKENLKLKESDTWNCTSRNSKPQESYGAEKLNTEILISSLVDSSISLEDYETIREFPQFKVARFHNVYGEGGTWYGGREKAPAALLRKAICSNKFTKENTIEIWGNGKQKRSFLYIEDCVDAVIEFMKSDLDLTLNIGSEESISIDELAYVAFETIGVSRENITLKFHEDKPVGVNNRNSDNTLIKKYLNWSPKYSIREGMEKTSRWIQQELEKQHNQYKNDQIGWNKLIKSHLESKILICNNEITFGVLLPITSRGLTKPEDCLGYLSNFAKSLYKTSEQDTQYKVGETRYQIKIYVGIDKDDTLFHPIKNNPAERILYEHGFTNINTAEFDFPPGSICEIWRELARKAYDDNCDYFVLFGDDVIIETDGWMSKFHEAYHKISIQKKVPRGFGCVTFTDTSFHGFPTFPVIGRVHLDIFNGDILPQQKFQNQDGDPYLFQTYRRWGCSIMLQDVNIKNFIGGSQDPRYERRHNQNWSFEILDNSVNRVEEWLKNNCKNPVPKLLTLDIIVPSYRVDLKYLDPIISLEKPETMSTTIIIIIDDPNSSNINIVKKFYEKGNPFFRIRVNKTNLGASLSRNRGLRECNADYVLFFDDDVIPEKDILFECEKIIKKHPNACGFIGNSRFPPANESIYTSALVLSGLTFFWGISEIWDDDIPWGVTANLLIRRCSDSVLYDPIFPKTGGGEDIDFCLKQRNFFIKNVKNGKGFHAAPDVKVTHPWWNNSKRDYWRFYKWATGDGALIKMYPEFTYNDIVPNSAELLLITTSIFFITVIFSLFISINIFTVLSFLSIPLVIISSVISDVHLHLTKQHYKRIPTVGGYRHILAMAESALIRIMSELGRLVGLIKRTEWKYIGRRFDWFVGRIEGTIKEEKNNNLKKLFIWISLMVLSFSIIITW